MKTFEVPGYTTLLPNQVYTRSASIPGQTFLLIPSFYRVPDPHGLFTDLRYAADRVQRRKEGKKTVQVPQELREVILRDDDIFEAIRADDRAITAHLRKYFFENVIPGTFLDICYGIVPEAVVQDKHIRRYGQISRKFLQRQRDMFWYKIMLDETPLETPTLPLEVGIKLTESPSDQEELLKLSLPPLESLILLANFQVSTSNVFRTSVDRYDPEEVKSLLTALYQALSDIDLVGTLTDFSKETVTEELACHLSDFIDYWDDVNEGNMPLWTEAELDGF